MKLDTAGRGIGYSGAHNWIQWAQNLKQRGAKFETVGRRIGNRGAQNWKQRGAEFETAGHGI